MHLYSLNEEGRIISLSEVQFNEDDAFIIENENVIYLWFGRKVKPQIRYKLLQEARNLNKKKGNHAKLLLMNQGNEYGSFLKIKDALLQKRDIEEPLEHRPTLEIGKPIIDPELLGDFESKVQVEAYFISKRNLTYNELCWLLAEKQLEIMMWPEKPTEDDIRPKAEEIFNSFCTYDELCWLLAELTVLQRDFSPQISI
ncbi:MAG: hypothetical protein ACP6IY_06560 [Promethearchaeia archaeon]